MVGSKNIHVKDGVLTADAPNLDTGNKKVLW